MKSFDVNVQQVLMNVVGPYQCNNFHDGFYRSCKDQAMVYPNPVLNDYFNLLF